MQAYFWGTRGSLPVGPDGVAIRQKIKQALLEANGRQFENDAAVDRFIAADLEFPLRHKHYCMFHHEPACGDETLHRVLGETRRYAEIAGDEYALQVSTAYDGLVIDV
jgi:hypothetical protein